MKKTELPSDEVVLADFISWLSQATSLGASRRQVYDALTRGTNLFYDIGSELPDGPVHKE